MTVTAERQPVEMWERRFSVADLAEMPSALPSGPVRYELDNGRLLTMAPSGDEHGAVESNLVARLKYEGELRGHGRLRCGEVGIVLWRNPDRVVGADAAFIANASLPIRRTPEGFLETIPDLVVEVVSKNDTAPYVRRKVEDYLTAGVKVVWVANPANRVVTEYRPWQEPREYREGDTLKVDDLIPDFSMPVEEVFRV